MRKSVVLVTGASSGIGLGCARKFATNGYRVILNGRNAGRLADAKAAIDAEGGETYVLPFDVCDREAVRQALASLPEDWRDIDVLVNNAGVACKKRLDILETTPESVDRLININLKGTFYMCQKGANYMISKLGKIENYQPRIINISSISAYTSSVSRGEYCISKAGISMVTELFADRLAEYSIPVFEVRPGIIMTDMTECVKDKYIKMIEEDGITPIRRMGMPEDVAKCVKAAASGLLDFGTGTVLNADGGFHIRRL